MRNCKLCKGDGKFPVDTDGEGHVELEECPECRGSGFEKYTTNDLQYHAKDLSKRVERAYKDLTQKETKKMSEKCPNPRCDDGRIYSIFEKNSSWECPICKPFRIIPHEEGAREKKNTTCSVCRGNGLDGGFRCANCNGVGWLTIKSKDKSLGQIARDMADGWHAKLDMLHCDIASDDVWEKAAQAVASEAIRRQKNEAYDLLVRTSFCLDAAWEKLKSSDQGRLAYNEHLSKLSTAIDAYLTKCDEERKQK